MKVVGSVVKICHRRLSRRYEVEVLKQAWSISSGEIDLTARIDDGFEGAFGEVWRGTWDGLDVAIKVS